jgi:hypothetical protein
MKELPDFEYGFDSDPKVRQMQAEGSFALRNSGDEVTLQDKSGGTVDVIIYGNSVYEDDGWQGEPLKRPREGMVYKREGVKDTDQSEDWILLPFGASYFPPEIIRGFGEVTAFVSPDCSFAVTPFCRASWITLLHPCISTCISLKWVGLYSIYIIHTFYYISDENADKRKDNR